ncbi:MULTISPECIES: hypothetical protein [unclassified Cupriavidus]|uniref:hypothetical protein n=1 Tax=unclassified Cupriavidus TaxID=2640874 RepID=UPI000885C156|nr:hypothetical protein [Cupriavidus sp. YR651]SDC85262.1 hypothetical protein SAMN05216345_104167 [Cupriavidus sp. YR651]
MTSRSLLLIATIGFVWAGPAPAAGCQYDMQCKGERICQQGQCVAADSDDGAEAPVQKLAPSTKASAPARLCCTVAGKLKLIPSQSGDASLAVGDNCQGATSSGKPVPGTICN